MISNAPIILNLDCDMYSNDPDAVREALCFFMDEKRGHEISYVQHPQRYENITKNDIYSNACNVVNKVRRMSMLRFPLSYFFGLINRSIKYLKPLGACHFGVCNI